METRKTVTIDHLHHAVEEFLGDTGALLHPRLLLLEAEELRGLQDPDGGVVPEVRHRLLQEVRPGAEVRVQNGDGLPRGAREGIPEVARLLQRWSVVASDVYEVVVRFGSVRLGSVRYGSVRCSVRCSVRFGLGPVGPGQVARQIKTSVDGGS